MTDDYDDLVDDPDEVVDLEGLSTETVNRLDMLMSFIGRNVIAGKEKVAAVKRLRTIANSDDRPNSATIEAFAERAGKRDKVARQLRAVYDGLLGGKGFRDTGGRPI